MSYFPHGLNEVVTGHVTALGLLSSGFAFPRPSRQGHRSFWSFEYRLDGSTEVTGNSLLWERLIIYRFA